MAGCRSLTRQELKAIKEAGIDAFPAPFPLRAKALFTLGYTAGARVAELLSLTVGKVRRNGVIVEMLTFDRRNMKGKRQSRTVKIRPDAKTALAEWIGDMESHIVVTDSTPLFANMLKGSEFGTLTGQQANNIVKGIFANVIHDEFLVNLATHTMRKTFARLYYEECVRMQGRGLMVDPIREVQRALGHSSVQTTERYLDFHYVSVPDEAFNI
jgi:integrase